MTAADEHIGGEGPNGSKARKRPSAWARIAKLLAAIPVGFVILSSLVLLALEIDPLVNSTAQWALGRFDPLDGASMTAEKVGGGLLSGLVVDDFRITSDAGREMVRVPSAEASLRLLPLFRSRISLGYVRIQDPVVRMRQLADSSWDLVSTFPIDTTDAPSSTIVSIDHLLLNRGEAELTFRIRDPDSTVDAWALNMAASNFATGEGFQVDLDSLSARFRPLGASDTVFASVGLRYANRRLDLRELTLQSALSDVSGNGSIVFPGDQQVDSVGFRVQASPLSFRDIHPFFPRLNPAAEVRLEVHAAGDGRSINADASAGFGDGSSLSARGSFSPPGTDMLSMTVDATVDRLSTSYLFTDGPTSASVLSGSIDGDVAGPSRDSLNGNISLRLDPFEVARYDIDALDAIVRFNDGQASFRLQSVLNGSDLRLTGWARPFDEAPAYEGELRFRNLNPSILAELSQPSNLQGVLRISGEGFSAETANATAMLDLGRGHWNEVPLEGGLLNARLKASRITADLGLRVGGGAVSARGNLALGERPTYSIQSMSLDSLPVAALIGDTLRSSVSGRLSGSGTGLEIPTMVLQASIELSESRYGDTEIRSARSEIRLQRETVQAAGRAEVRGGIATFDITGRPFATNPRYEIGELSFRSVDIAALTGKSAWVTDLTGRLTGEIRVADGESSGSLSVVLDTSRVNDQTITSARLDGTLGQGRLAGVFDLATPRGRLSAAADATPFDVTPSYRFTDGTFEDIDVGAFLGRDKLDTRLNGTFGLSLSGLDPETLTADGRFEIQRSRFNGENIETGRLSIAADSGIYSAEGAFELTDATLDMSGSADLNDAEPFEIRGSIDRLNIAGLLGADSLDSRVSATFYAAGAGLQDQRTTGQGRLVMSASNYQDIKIESVAANLSIDGKLLRVDTLTAKSNVATLTGSGLVALSSDPDLPASNLQIAAELKDLRPMHSVVPPAARLVADGVVRLSFSGEPDDVRFRADGQLTKIAYGNLRIGEVDARVVGSLDENRRVAAAESRIEISQLSLPTATARTTRFEAAYADDTVRYEANSTLDNQRQVRTSGTVDLSGEDVELTMNSLRVVLDQERWELLQPSTISFGEEYRIQNFLLYSETQQIAVDGYIDLDGEQSLILTIEQFRIGSVADFFDYAGLNGTLNGYVDLTGPAQAPIVTGSLTAEIMSSGKPVGDFSADLSYADLRLDIDGRLRNESGSALTIEGHLPLDLRLSAREDEAAGVGVRTAAAGGDSRLTVKSDGFAIDWILPFLDPELFNSIGGVLTGQMDVTGTFSDPELSGEATLTGGRVGLTEFGVTFTKLRGDFGFVENRIEVNHLEAKSGEGSAIVTGSVSLSELTLGSFDLDISSENFLAVDNREYRASAASDLRLSGSTRRPVLNGSVNVASADLFLTEEIEEFEAVKLSLEDLQTVEQRFGIRISEKDTTTFSFYDALSMDLTVQLSRNTWLRSKKSPEMDIQFTGDLEVRKERKQFAQVFGTIEVIPERSRIVQFGKTFSITKGTLTYNGPIDDPILDIEAEYDIRAWRNPENQVTITLAANGRFDDLDVELSSDPTMEMTDIVSYIAFGRPASESLHLGGSGTGGSLATDLALGQIAGLIEDVAGTGLGLDVIEIEQQGLDARLTAGKYVHRRVYLAISQPLNLGSNSSSSVSSTPEITAEFEMLKSLLLRVLSRRSSISVNLLWQYAY